MNHQRKHLSTNTLALVLLALTSLSLLNAPATASEWLQWRGPTETGYTPVKGIPDTWDQSGKNLIWKRSDLGARSGPLVHKGRVFLINKAGSGINQQERVVAIDLHTGKTIWEHRFNVFLTDIVAHRLGWSNLAIDPETGNIYAHGVQGLFFCFDFDGKILWQRSMTEEFGRISGYGGRTNTPVVDGDLVIINFLTSGWGPHGKPVHRFMAMNKLTGELVWWSSPSGKPLDTTYSVPVVAEIGGQRLLIAGLADGAVHAIKVSTGEPVWHFKLSKRGINSSVVVDGNRVYACHGEENFDSTEMGRVVCIDGRGFGDITATGELWRHDTIAASYTSLLLAKKVLYVADNSGNLHALNPKTGKRNWLYNYGNNGKGSGVYADGKIYIGEVGGSWHILKPSEKGCETLSSQTFNREDGSPDEIYGSPAIVDGRVILPTNSELYCIGNPKTKVKPTKRKSVKTKHGQGPATHLQVVPAETWIKPGETLAYTVHAFNEKGQLVPTPKTLKWSAKGVSGTFNGNSFTSAKKSPMQAGIVTLTAGDLSASVRLRLIPQLPISFNFDKNPKGLPPAGWISSKLKTQVQDYNGAVVLKKMSDRPAPPFARLRCYMTNPLDVGYTVQADMLGEAKKKRFIPDMGLINCRYNLVLLGTSEMKRTLRLVTWAPMPRLQKDIDFDWKPGVWYSVKLSVDVKNGKGLINGKVWPRGEKEPTKWTIQAEDPHPNPAGSPGLYAYSVNITSRTPGTPVYFDNVSITRN